jgi:Putative peptidoglycan binding domain
MWVLGAGCLAAVLCVTASAADTANTGTKHKQVKRPETESHRSEAKANTAIAKSSHPEVKSASKGQTTHHSAHEATAHKKAHTAGTGSHHGKKTKPVSSRRGQQKIDSDRTRQIQEALIREHYLQGEPSGKWDASTEDALRKMQADNGWQNKTVPDSRALIKMGLGPNQDHLLNPESAMTSAPEATRATIQPTSASSSPSQPQ